MQPGRFKLTPLLRRCALQMFRPEANRLCKFLEFSAMSLQLATKGGSHGKQGYLRVLSSGASRHQKPGFRPLALKRRHEPKWFMVRESYIVATDEPYSVSCGVESWRHGKITE